jgi:hypothetical protein
MIAMEAEWLWAAGIAASLLVILGTVLLCTRFSELLEGAERE